MKFALIEKLENKLPNTKPNLETQKDKWILCLEISIRNGFKNNLNHTNTLHSNPPIPMEIFFKNPFKILDFLSDLPCY